MSIYATLGVFYVTLATGLFTAAILIAAIWSIVIGLTTAKRRYKVGYELERTLGEHDRSGTTGSSLGTKQR